MQRVSAELGGPKYLSEDPGFDGVGTVSARRSHGVRAREGDQLCFVFVKDAEHGCVDLLASHSGCDFVVEQ